MYTFLSLIFIILLSLIILLSVFHVKVIFAFSSEQYTDLNLIVSWLYPMFKAIVTNEDNSLIISFYLFNKKVFKRNLKSKKSNKKFSFDLIKSLKLDYVTVRTSYGFENPAITGWVCTAISLVLHYVKVKDLYNNPDFSMNSNYINLNAETKVNVMSTLINLFKLKAAH